MAIRIGTAPVNAIVIETDKEAREPGYQSRWDVLVAEVSTMLSVRKVHAEYEKALGKEQSFVSTHKKIRHSATRFKRQIANEGRQA